MEPTAIDTHKRRQLRVATEDYPDIDFDKVNEVAEHLRGAASDSEAVSMLVGDSAQVVHQRD